MVGERLAAQLLSGEPARDPVAVAERLLAVQAQDLRRARLAIRARTTGLSVADVDRALGDRTLLVTWLNRGTLHLVGREDYPWLQALTTQRPGVGNARRLAELGVSPAAAERGVRVVERSLAVDGPLTRRQLRERLDAADVPTAGQACIHVLMLACLRGIAVRGPMAGSEQAYVLVREWLGAPSPVDRDRALGELARRYLAGHGPADDRDLARWAGISLRDARAGLRSVGRELEERADGLVDRAGRPSAPELPPPRLLGPYEPVLLGWTSRAPLLGDDDRVVANNGLFRAFALVRGRGVATWRMRDGKLTLEPFARLRRDDTAALERDAADVARFLLPPTGARATLCAR